MKYLLSIFIFAILSSLLTLYYFWPHGQHPAVSVSGKKENLRGGYHQKGEYDRSQAFNTRNILVREAQRLGIDKEKGFRSSLKEYYEQSLVKVLTDRKLAEIVVNVKKEDIDHYLNCSGKIFTFTRFTVENGNVLTGSGQASSVIFDDLSLALRLILAEMKVGDEVTQFETGTETSVIRLDKVTNPPERVRRVYDRTMVREQLENYQRSLEIDRWIHSLLENSGKQVK